MTVKEELQNILSLIDVKLEQNSKSVNITIHTYEGATDEKIIETINKTIAGLHYADKKLKEIGLKQ